MTLIVGISGSLRRASYNTGLLRAAQAVVPDGVQIEIVSISDIPLYDGDLELAQGLPSAVTLFKESIARADALLLATPEYNNGIPGVMKNAIDWASRPASDIVRVFGGKRAALIGASPGRFGTILSQDAWLSVLRTLGVELWSGSRLMVAGASPLFDAEGNLSDIDTQSRLRGFLASFVDAIAD
jgi:chromate reductase, NAD(P)H dehydrogenase (quinone)